MFCCFTLRNTNGEAYRPTTTPPLCPVARTGRHAAFAALSDLALRGAVGRPERLALVGAILGLHHARLGARELLAREAGVVVPLLALSVHLHRLAAVQTLDCGEGGGGGGA